MIIFVYIHVLKLNVININIDVDVQMLIELVRKNKEYLMKEILELRLLTNHSTKLQQVLFIKRIHWVSLLRKMPRNNQDTRLFQYVHHELIHD
jgi:hypothetical protein